MTLVEGLEQMGVRLEGMPDLEQPNDAIINNENVTEFAQFLNTYFKYYMVV